MKLSTANTIGIRALLTTGCIARKQSKKCLNAKREIKMKRTFVDDCYCKGSLPTSGAERISLGFFSILFCFLRFVANDPPLFHFTDFVIFAIYIL